MKGPTRVAAASIHVASAPELEGVTGRYFSNSALKRSAWRSYDEALVVRLWRLRADLVGLDSRPWHGPDPPTQFRSFWD
ncbi:MAG: retinol dehydrogenase 14 [Micromonosporaceae bacterium]|nr:retinol dehydrogenase 14 [Micromonosporaceae bacterium]